MRKNEIKEMEHNQSAIKEIDKCIKNNETFVCSNAQGSGKSILIEHVLRKKKCMNSLVVVNDTRTSVAKLAKELKKDLVTYLALPRVDVSKYDYVVCDEAHHILSAKCKDIAVRLSSEKKLLLFTATTQRTDRQDLVDIVDKEINTITFGDAVVAGIYPKPTYIQSFLREADSTLGNYKTKAKLDGRSAYETLKKYMSNQNKIIVFNYSNKQMERDYALLSKPLQELGFETKMFSTKHYDKEVIDWINNSNHKVAVFVCNLLNESHHLSGVDGEIILRHTGSLIVVNQQIGRIATFDTDAKIVILDLACNHKLIESFAEGSKLDELGDYFKVTDSEGNKRRSNISDILDVEFDVEQLDPWSSRLKIKYQGKEYLATDFARSNNIKYSRVCSFILNNKVYTDSDINKKLFSEQRKQQYTYYVDGKVLKRTELIKLLGISHRRFIEEFKDKTYFTGDEIANFTKTTSKAKVLFNKKHFKTKQEIEAFHTYCRRNNLDGYSEDTVKMYREYREKMPTKYDKAKMHLFSTDEKIQISELAIKRNCSVKNIKKKLGHWKLEDLINERDIFKVYGKVYKTRDKVAKEFCIAPAKIAGMDSIQIEKFLAYFIYGIGTTPYTIEWKEYSDLHEVFVAFDVKPLDYSKWCKGRPVDRLRQCTIVKYLKEKKKIK